LAKDWDSIDVKPKGNWAKRTAKHSGYRHEYAVKILKTVMNAKDKTEPYKHELRISKLPYCGLVDLNELIDAKPRLDPYSMRFYTSQGTALHENIQNSFAYDSTYGDIVIGRWKCKRCQFICQEVGPLPHEGICPNCRPNVPTLEYHELDFWYRDKISGHLDQLTRDRKGNYAAWEYKTTGEYNVHNPEKYLPYPKHIGQIETYCGLLWRQYKILPKVFFIVYLNRNKVQQDDTQTEEFTVFAFKITKANLRKRLAHLDSMVDSDIVIQKILKDPSKEHIKELEELRPCRSRADYDGFMAHHFFGAEQCPFVEGETCFLKRKGLTEAGNRAHRELNRRRRS
jgi:hypothetical protein